MVTIEKIDTNDKKQVRRFTRFPMKLYAGCSQWVPPLLIDAEMQLNKKKHPFYEHSYADFFMAVKDGKDVGRIAALENCHFNEYHKTKQAQFYLFDSIDDQEVADSLMDAVYKWSRERGLTDVVGPKGFGAVDGYGLLVEGFEHRQMMTMMNYNYDYYPRLIENMGFEKEVDFVSHYADAQNFRLPERIHRIADRVQKRGTLRVQRFKSKAELKQWADRIGEAYNNSFVNNWEYFPLTDHEIKFLLDNLLAIAVPSLIKVIVNQDEKVVGFLFAFPDVSAALQRAKGRLFPFGVFDLLLEMKRTKWISVNGAGILPEYQGVGGNALMYSEMEKTVSGAQFKHADFTQVAETAVQMRNDLTNLGGKRYKNHRVYHRIIP